MSKYRRKLMMAYAANLGRGDIIYPGLIAAWSAKGKSNDDEDRATLRDLTGNGHDITLNGFAFSKMSGYGGYNYNFANWFSSSIVGAEVKSKTIVIINGYPSKRGVFEKNLGTATPKTILRLKVSIEIKNNPNKLPIRMYFTGAADYPSKNIDITESGIYELPQVTSNKGNGYYIGFQLNNSNNLEGDENYYCKIELLPEYPDALVFDGVDDYGESEYNVPILSDFTVIMFREIFDSHLIEGYIFNIIPYNATNWQEAILCSERPSLARNTTVSFGAYTDHNKIYKKGIIYITPTNYNGTSIYRGDVVTTQKSMISLSNPKLQGTEVQYAKMAFYSAYLFDRTLDEQEIKSFIRKYIDPEYLLPSEIPTPDCYYDFSQGSNDDETRDTIKDYSGNGNDAVAHNFAWSGMSGYGGFVLDDSDFTKIPNRPVTVSNHIITLNKCNYDESLIYNDTKYIDANTQRVVINRPAFKIKVSGVGENEYIRIFGSLFDGNMWSLQNIIQKIGNGITDIPAINRTYNQAGTEGNKLIYQDFIIVVDTTDKNKISSESIITIELLPEYPGALVFDGVDDYVSLDAFDSGFKTIFMVCNPFKMDKILYDQRKGTPNDFAIYNDNSIAYTARNINNTFINNKLNTTKFSSYFINKKHLININSKNPIGNIIQPVIGSNVSHTGSSLFANMALYKFLGFKDELTEEQINAIIKKYNLLDGVDEIEVS